MEFGICAGHEDEPQGAPILEALHERNLFRIRRDFPGKNEDQMRILVKEIADARQNGLLLVGHGQVVNDPPDVLQVCGAMGARLARDCGMTPETCGLEVVNEANFSPLYKDNPALLADAVRRVHAVSLGLPVLIGGLCGVTPGHMEYLRNVIAAGVPDDVLVAIHPYREGQVSPTIPRPGYSSRQAENDALIAAAGGREIWSTEIGWNAWGPKPKWWEFNKRQEHIPDEQIAAWLRDERDIESAFIAKMIVYQINCAPQSERGEQWGIRYEIEDDKGKGTGEWVWKPAAEIALF